MKKIKKVLQKLYVPWISYIWIRYQLWRKREIRLPGGTTRDGDEAALGIIYRKRKHDIEILVIAYTPQAKEEVIYDVDENIVTEEMKPHYDEMAEGALERKIAAETGIVVHSFIHLFSRSKRDTRPGREGQRHWQNLFIVKSYDDSNIRVMRLNKKISTPMWITLRQARKYLWPHHRRWGLPKFEEHLSSKEPAIRFTLKKEQPLFI
jgi:hypothetical protein